MDTSPSVDTDAGHANPDSQESSVSGKLLDKFLALLEVIEENHQVNSSSSLASQTGSEVQDEDRLLEILAEVQQSLGTKENCVKDMILNLCNYMQFIFDGLTHWVHRKEIYGNNLEGSKKFLASLTQVCAKIAECCHNYFDRSWTVDSLDACSSKTLRFSVDTLIDTSISNVILSTDNVAVLPSVAKVLVLILKHIRRLIDAPQAHAEKLLKHLAEMLQEFTVSDLDPKDESLSIKKINYFGKIVRRYCAHFPMTPIWTPPFLTILEIARIIEVNGFSSKFQGFYTEMINGFFSLDFPMSVFEDTMSSWPWDHRILFKLELMVNSKGFQHRTSGRVLVSILRDIAQHAYQLDEEKLTTELQGFLDRKVLPSVFKLIRELDSNQFDTFLEALVVFLITEKEIQCCFVACYFICDIFGYMIQLAPDAVAREILTVFSSSRIPTQIKLFLLPELLNYSRDENAKHQNEDVLSAVLIKTMKMHNTTDDNLVNSKFIKLFWSRQKHNWDQKFSQKLIPICYYTVGVLHQLDSASVSVILSAVEEQLHRPPVVEPYTILLASVLLIGLGQLHFNSSKEWDSVRNISTKILSVMEDDCRTLSKPMRHFIVKAFCSFLSRVQVQSEEMLDNLRPPNWEESETESCAKSLTRLEHLVKDMEDMKLEFNDEKMQVRLRCVLSRLSNFVESKEEI